MSKNTNNNNVKIRVKTQLFPYISVNGYQFNFNVT